MQTTPNPRADLQALASIPDMQRVVGSLTPNEGHQENTVMIVFHTIPYALDS